MTRFCAMDAGYSKHVGTLIADIADYRMMFYL